jgi:hypothetical protein
LTSLSNVRVAALIVVAVVLSSGLGLFGGSSRQHTVTTASISTVSTEITDVIQVTTTVKSISTTMQAVNGTVTQPFPSLELSARVYPENLTLGENVSIISEVYNSLPESVQVEAPPINDPSEAWCPFSSPTAVTLHLGYYTFANLTGAVYLLQYNGANEGACSTPPFIAYTFLPNSDEAILQTIPPDKLRAPTAINSTTSLSGYFGNLAGETLAFQAFTPGTYTVLVSDAWGQEKLCYFTVA